MMPNLDVMLIMTFSRLFPR